MKKLRARIAHRIPGDTLSLPMAADFRSAVCTYLIDARSAFATSLAISSCTANLSSNGRS
jgi:hypothetical protein